MRQIHESQIAQSAPSNDHFLSFHPEYSQGSFLSGLLVCGILTLTRDQERHKINWNQLKIIVRMNVVCFVWPWSHLFCFRFYLPLINCICSSKLVLTIQTCTKNIYTWFSLQFFSWPSVNAIKSVWTCIPQASDDQTKVRKFRITTKQNVWQDFSNPQADAEVMLDFQSRVQKALPSTSMSNQTSALVPKQDSYLCCLCTMEKRFLRPMTQKNKQWKQYIRIFCPWENLSWVPWLQSLDLVWAQFRPHHKVWLPRRLTFRHQQLPSPHRIVSNTGFFLKSQSHRINNYMYQTALTSGGQTQPELGSKTKTILEQTQP